MLRIQTELSEEMERLIQRTIGCCIAVHRELGPGLLEAIYTRAVCIELDAQAIAFETEKPFPISYRGRLLCHQRLDFVAAGQLVLELKAVNHLEPVHRAQLLSYLHGSKLRAGLLINFNVPILQEGLKRVVP